eukprot:TRINITY_DN4062_c0_g1_i1.p1 TRINITY_DN4062_c0_g1~~TRINITY_DN4062_c0_g1_i1.p1  ORF type:complete len:1815 (-),score=391.80 TRINITY_DN4062_c0_g1_i1:165-5240(-)
MVAHGMSIFTDNPEAIYRSNSNLTEFLGTKKLADLMAIEEVPEIESLVEFSKVAQAEGVLKQRQFAIVRDNAKCCACTRCVRACSVVQNMKILSINDESETQPIIFENNLPLHATACIACGQCTVVCPTHAVAERDDTAIVEAMLKATGADRKITIVQTAPAARVCLGEMVGDEPGNYSTSKTVAALHAAGFNLVFDTTFGADTCSIIEAIELIDRIQSKGALPMFTSCCPGWVRMVDFKFPHLRAHLSRCKSPMMMLGALIRKYFVELKGLKRSDYFVVALMPCLAKKEEITRPELRSSDGTCDVDVVLTTREMGRLLRRCGVDWDKLPGENKDTYDEPFNYASGGGSLFSVSGGVTESVARVASAYLSNEPCAQDTLFSALRQTLSNTLAVEAEVPVDVSGKQIALDFAVVSGGRDIQSFLQAHGLDDLHTMSKRAAGESTAGLGVLDAKQHLIECMACPGGCIMGGGQPRTLLPNVQEKRKAAAYTIDRRQSDAENPCSLTCQREFLEKLFGDVASEMAREALEYVPPMHAPTRYRKHHHHPRALAGSSAYSGSSYISGASVPSESTGTSMESPMDSHSVSGYSGISDTASVDTNSLFSDESWEIVIAYGSQGGSTVTRARSLQDKIEQVFDRDIRCISLDQLAMRKLPAIKFLIILTSTWETESSIFPYNAQPFWEWLQNRTQSEVNNLLLATSFSVLGFGSPRYDKYCGAATLIHQALARLGAYPLLECTKVDVDRADKGRKPVTQFTKRLLHLLSSPDVTTKNFILLPTSYGTSKDSKKDKLSCPSGYSVVTVNTVKPYKSTLGQVARFTYVEFDTTECPGLIPKSPEDQLFVLPCNPQHEVEETVTLFSDNVNSSVSIVPVGKQENGNALPANVTLRQLFGQFVDLHHKPQLHFMRALEEQINVVDRQELSELLNNARGFRDWIMNQTYASVLKMYKAVLPPLEVLTFMLPRMMPRPYTPIHFEPARDTSIGICVRVYENGLASKWLSTLKKGDKVLCFLSKSPFPKPSENLLVIPSSPTMDSSLLRQSATECVLQFSKTVLTFGDKLVTPGVVATDQFEIKNPTQEQHRFIVSLSQCEGFEVQVQPPTGIVKPGFVITLYVLFKVTDPKPPPSVDLNIRVTTQELIASGNRQVTVSSATILLHANIRNTGEVVTSADLLKRSAAERKQRVQQRQLAARGGGILTSPRNIDAAGSVTTMDQLQDMLRLGEGAALDKFVVVSPPPGTTGKAFVAARFGGKCGTIVTAQLDPGTPVRTYPSKKSISGMATSYPYLFTMYSDGTLCHINLTTGENSTRSMGSEYSDVKALVGGFGTLVIVLKTQISVWRDVEKVQNEAPKDFSISPSFSIASCEHSRILHNKNLLLVNGNPAGHLFQVWNTDTGKAEGYSAGLPGGTPLASRVDGYTLLMSNPNGIFIWNLASLAPGQVYAPICVKHPRVPTALYVDTHTIIVGDNCGGVSLYNPDGSFIYDLNASDIIRKSMDLSVSHKVTRVQRLGRWVTVGFEDCRVNIYDLFTANANNPVDSYVHSTLSGVRHIALSESKLVVVLANSTAPEAVIWWPRLGYDQQVLQTTDTPPIVDLMQEFPLMLAACAKLRSPEVKEIAACLQDAIDKTSKLALANKASTTVLFQHCQHVHVACTQLRAQLLKASLAQTNQHRASGSLFDSYAVEESLKAIVNSVNMLCRL